jgi:6-phosphogluconolactonase
MSFWKILRTCARVFALALLCSCAARPALTPPSEPTTKPVAAFEATVTAPAPAGSPLVFVGTYTSGAGGQQRADGIFIYRMDPATGALTQVGKMSGIANPSYLAVDPSGRYLLAVSESAGTVSSYAIDPEGGDAEGEDAHRGSLTLINRQPVGGDSPCYVSIDPSGKWVLVANYMGGSVTVLPLGDDGRLGASTALVKHSGSGPNKNRQEAPHVHSAILAPGSSLALVADLGIDRVMLYDLDTAKGTLAAHAVPALELKPGAGPRHMVFHPNQRFLYVVGELLSTVTAYQYDTAAGNFQELETLPLLPADFQGQNTSADIHITPDGKFLYASNRGNNSLAIFSIDPATGKLTLVGHAPTQGQTPRNFAIDPTGSFLLVANQDSGAIVTFRIDPATGNLTATGQKTEVPSPVCVKFLH